ncbi:hypothetical protein I8J29_03425 [Paenibacillus sp. MWE-103]|uniref:Uncharacterized protein n=1 Tax=Paenibacillus artemisiicola TaxID=1172618 RepID=A0ABS3W4X6_9BACL|nr:hypothetical protein [Paenibacillus artemisiicola]MBO7743231.1 hypothetical protein [Paenibacillus artemisiicola]
MVKGAAFLLELARIVVLLFLTLFLLDGLERAVFGTFGEPRPSLLRGVGNFALFVVLYRNALQFNGWYKSERSRRLGRAWTMGLILMASGAILSSAWT